MPTHQLELTTIKRAWLDDSAWTLSNLLPRLGRFSTDDLHAVLPSPSHPNWFGVLMSQLRSKGIVREAGRITSRRREANGRKISVWEANL